jgi:hypothetical protein
MKKQILLLLGLVLIGTLGLAAGIEASKGKWDYRSLVRSRTSWQGAQATTQTILATKTVSSPAVSVCAANDSVPDPFVRFVLKRGEGQQNAMSEQTPCVAATEEEKKAKRISFCPGCPGEDATEVDLQSLIAPQRPLPPSESVPSDTAAVRFIG